MSIQEMKSELHQLIDKAESGPVLEQLLDSAKAILSDQSTKLSTLSELTDTQRQQLEKAIQEHKSGNTVSHAEMQQRHRKWLNK